MLFRLWSDESQNSVKGVGSFGEGAHPMQGPVEERFVLGCAGLQSKGLRDSGSSVFVSERSELRSDSFQVGRRSTGLEAGP